jgi:hypothetical protein
MPAMTSARALGFIAVAATALVMTGCGVTTTTSTTPTRGTATSSAPAPMTAADLAWIQSITELHQQVDKHFGTNIYMTRAKMRELSRALRSCQRELGQIGSPSTHLQRAYVLVQQACAVYVKGARCFAKAASVTAGDGSVVAGTREERISSRAQACGFAALGNGGNLMTEAEAKASQIRAQYP